MEMEAATHESLKMVNEENAEYERQLATEKVENMQQPLSHPYAVNHSFAPFAAYAFDPPPPETHAVAAAVLKETPECDMEVRDESMLQIMSSKTSRAEVK